MPSFRDRQRAVADAQKKSPPPPPPEQSTSEKNSEQKPRPKLIAKATNDPFRPHKKDKTPVDEQMLLKKLGIVSETPPRKLGETTPDVPFTFLSKKDSERTKLFKTALLAEETELGIWLDTQRDSTETAWICVRVPEQEQLILLHELPLMSRFLTMEELSDVFLSTPHPQTNSKSSAEEHSPTDPNESLSSKPNTSVPF